MKIVNCLFCGKENSIHEKDNYFCCAACSHRHSFDIHAGTWFTYKEEPPTDSVESTLAERGKTHGSFVENGRIMQQLKDVIRSGVNWDTLEPYQKEALDMTCHKMGRILSGDPNEPDHWVDICGYNKLVEKELKNES